MQLHVTNMCEFVQNRYISARHPKRIGPNLDPNEAEGEEWIGMS